jgi:hypothetical protein
MKRDPKTDRPAGSKRAKPWTRRRTADATPPVRCPSCGSDDIGAAILGHNERLLACRACLHTWFAQSGPR